MANTYKVLVGLVNQVESLGNLVVLLANTHISDQETITSITAEAQTIKQQAADAIKAAQDLEAKALETQKQADAVLDQDQQEEDLATRFVSTVDRLIEVATNALPPAASAPEPQPQPTPEEPPVNVAEPTINA